MSGNHDEENKEQRIGLWLAGGAAALSVLIILFYAIWGWETGKIEGSPDYGKTASAEVAASAAVASEATASAPVAQAASEATASAPVAQAASEATASAPVAQAASAVVASAPAAAVASAVAPVQAASEAKASAPVTVPQAAEKPASAPQATASAAAAPTPVVASSPAAVILADTAPADADTAQVVVDKGVVKFYFAIGKADLAKGAQTALKDVLEGVKAGKKAVISGYHDSTGNAAQNQELSKQRAFAVRDALLRFGVPEKQIELRKPVNAEAGKSAEARRVEVVLE